MSEPPAKKARRFGNDTVTIKVGTGDHVETFTIHEALLKERGGFFAAAMDKQWKEGQERKIGLPEDDPNTVGIYIEWLYTKRLGAYTDKDHKQWNSKDVEEQYDQLVHLYIFGEKIQDDEICNRCIDKIVELSDLKVTDADDGTVDAYCLDRSAVKTIFQGTHTASPLRRLCVDTYFLYSKKSWFDTSGEGRHAERHLLECQGFLLEVLQKFATNRESPPATDATIKPEQYYK
ncbi:unnamed protein product [Cercospora beticola]|nr:unnamed protein product [Cercospora beticola]